MSPQAKEEYFNVLFKRYKEATRREKTRIIDECCTVCGYHRKHAIRRLRGYKRFTKPRKRKEACRQFTLFQKAQGYFVPMVV